MKINYDIDVVCPACSEKAQFFFPFRRIYEKDIDQVRLAYPNATFEEISPNLMLFNGVIVNEFFGSKSVAIKPDSISWLMNLFPKLFDAPADLGKLTGLIKCPKCGLVRKSSLTDEIYFYKIRVDSRYLLAKKRENLIFLRNFFASGKRPYRSPSEDFPSTFYSNSKQIIEDIDKFLHTDI